MVFDLERRAVGREAILVDLVVVYAQAFAVTDVVPLLIHVEDRRVEPLERDRLVGLSVDKTYEGRQGLPTRPGPTQGGRREKQKSKCAVLLSRTLIWPKSSHLPESGKQ